MANGKAKQAFLDALPETLKGIEHTGESDEVKALVMGIRDSVIAAFDETAPVPPARVRVQRCDEYVKPGQVRTTWEVVDDRLPGKSRIARTFDDEAKARDFARRIAPVGGGAYTFEAVDADEYFHDTDYELLGSMHSYGVISGCTVTGDAANMTVDLAAGVILHSGSTVTVAAATDAYTLVADGSNERWAALCISSAGTAALLSGDPAANGSSEPAKPEIGDRVLVAMAKIQAAQTVAANVEYMLDKRVITHSGATTVTKSSDETINTSTTLQDDDALTFAVVANGEYEVEAVVLYNSGATPDFKFAWTAPAGATIDGHAIVPTASNTSTGAVIVEAVAITTAVGVGAPIAVWCRFTVVVGGTAGNVTLQWAQNTSDAGNTSVLTNSWVKYRAL